MRLRRQRAVGVTKAKVRHDKHLVDLRWPLIRKESNQTLSSGSDYPRRRGPQAGSAESVDTRQVADYIVVASAMLLAEFSAVFRVGRCHAGVALLFVSFLIATSISQH